MEKMVMYLADLQLDIVHKFKATGGTGVEVPGSWGGIPWLRTESADATNGITNPHVRMVQWAGHLHRWHPWRLGRHLPLQSARAAAGENR